MGKIFIGIITLFMLLSTSVCAQNISLLLDSLALSKENHQKMDLSLKIASKLKLKDIKKIDEYVKVAEESAHRINNNDTWKQFYKRAGEVYGRLDLMDVYIVYLLEEYEYYKNSSDKRKYFIENQLGILYSRLNDKSLGLYYFNKLFEHYKEQKNFEEMGSVQISMGTLNLNYESPQTALLHYNKALYFLKNSNNEELSQLLNTNLGRVYTKLNKHKEAKIYLDKSYAQIDNDTDSSMISWIYNSFSQYYLQKRDLDQAISYGLKADMYVNEANGFEQKDVLETLYQSFLEKKDYENAAKYFTQYERVRKNLKIEETAVNVEKTKIEYLHKIKEQQNELRNNQKRFYFLAIICGLVILLLIMLIWMIRYRNRLTHERLVNELKESKENELNLQLEIRNKELAIKTLKETEQNAMFKNLKHDLNQIQLKDDAKETKKELNQILRMMEMNAKQYNWEEFELRFANVYENFYEKLNTNYPQLSANDIRICALIKLNFSTKEISHITKTSVKSVENIRTRLRKKLNLTNNKVDLYKFFIDF